MFQRIGQAAAAVRVDIGPVLQVKTQVVGHLLKVNYLLQRELLIRLLLVAVVRAE